MAIEAVSFFQGLLIGITYRATMCKWSSIRSRPHLSATIDHMAGFVIAIGLAYLVVYVVFELMLGLTLGVGRFWVMMAGVLFGVLVVDWFIAVTSKRSGRGG